MLIRIGHPNAFVDLYYYYNLTIIFSKRARISFSDVILEESSSNSEGVDQSPEEEFLAMWDR